MHLLFFTRNKEDIEIEFLFFIRVRTFDQREEEEAINSECCRQGDKSLTPSLNNDLGNEFANLFFPAGFSFAENPANEYCSHLSEHDSRLSGAYLPSITRRKHN